MVELQGIPVFCNVQYSTPETARSQARGDMRLVYCGVCRHFYNASFDPQLLDYDEQYENSLHFSATFDAYATDLAARLIEKYRLTDSTIVEIGCGKGDFLAMMCELGENHGIGFDRSFEHGRGVTPKRGNAVYLAELFSEEHVPTAPDLLVGRHVLEHIWDIYDFLKPLADVLSVERATPIYMEVPNALYTVRDVGIWDLIYEHCHYFTEFSLAEAFSRAGFGRIRTYEAFGGQFLGLEAARGATGRSLSGTVSAESEGRLAREFSSLFHGVLAEWRQSIRRANDGGRTAVVWGGGSKGVSFLNFLQAGNEIQCVVDINPHKQGSYTPGTGHPIVPPETLKDVGKVTVFVMNPMYRSEIARTLSDLGIDAVLEVVN